MAAMEQTVSVQVTDLVAQEYSKMVNRLCSPDEVIRSQITLNVKHPRLLHAAIGICTEGGELLDQIKKTMIYGREFDKVNFVEELGDLLWYLTLAANTVGITLAEIMMVNTAKLKKRYPHQWDAEKEQNRDLDGERGILEEGVAEAPTSQS